MVIYIILLLIILTGYFAVPQKNDRSKMVYCAVVCLTMILVVGLRDISVGKVDTEYIYTPRITKYFSYDYKGIWEFQSRDKIYYIVTKFLSNIKENVNFIFFIIGIPFIVSTTRLVKKYSKMAWLSFVLFLGMSYFTMSFFLLRQVVAMSITSVAFDTLMERKPIRFILLVLFASLFHQTALVFLLAYPLSRMKIGIKQWVGVIVAFVLSIAMRGSVLSSVFNLLNILFKDTSRYDTYQSSASGLGYTGFALQLVIFICITVVYSRRTSNFSRWTFKNGVLRRRKKNEDAVCAISFDEQINVMYNLAAVSLMIIPFSAMVGEFWRVASYFGIFNIILLPNTITTIKSAKFRKQITLCVASCFILYFLFIHLKNADAADYIFFWMS